MGNGLEPKNKVAESGGEEECEKPASNGRRQLPTQQAPQGAVCTPTPKRPTSNKRPKLVNTENWQRKHAEQSKQRVWNKVEPKTLQRKGRADMQEPTGCSEGRAKSGHTRLQRKQSQRGRELLPTHDRMSAGSTRCRNLHLSKKARNAQNRRETRGTSPASTPTKATRRQLPRNIHGKTAQTKPRVSTPKGRHACIPRMRRHRRTKRPSCGNSPPGSEEPANA